MTSWVILVHSLLCCIFGYSAFVAFLLLQNYPSSGLALVSGVTDSIILFLNILAYKETLPQWFSKKALKRFGYTGIVVIIATFTSSIYYISQEIYTKRPILPIAPSYVLPIIWSLIGVRAGSILTYSSIKYQRVLESEPLIIDEEQNEDSVASTRSVHSDNIE